MVNRRHGRHYRIPSGLRFLLTGFLAGIAAGAQPAPGAQPTAGYFVDPVDVVGQRTAQWDDSTGDFTISIRRAAPDSLSERLLSVAEATYPPRDLIAGIANAYGYEMGGDTVGVPLWWSRGVGVSRVPYAVTSRAVEHYARLTEFYRGRFRSPGTRPLHSSDFLYRATIAHRESYALGPDLFQDVYVAHLRLSWTWDDGSFEPRVDAWRIVVLTASGDLVGVDGDGEAVENVSISSKRGIGRVKHVVR